MATNWCRYFLIVNSISVVASKASGIIVLGTYIGMLGQYDGIGGNKQCSCWNSMRSPGTLISASFLAEL